MNENFIKNRNLLQIIEFIYENLFVLFNKNILLINNYNINEFFDKQTDRQTDKQTDNELTDKQMTDIQITNIQTNNELSNAQTDKQLIANESTDKLTDIQTQLTDKQSDNLHLNLNIKINNFENIYENFIIIIKHLKFKIQLLLNKNRINELNNAEIQYTLRKQVCVCLSVCRIICLTVCLLVSVSNLFDKQTD